MSEQTQLTLRRTTSYADRLRAYEVMIDGEVVGSVRARQSLTVPVSAGRHSLALRIDWCGSETVDFEVQTGQHILFDCGSNSAGWRIFLGLFYTFVRTHQYLWLRRAP